VTVLDEDKDAKTAKANGEVYKVWLTPVGDVSFLTLANVGPSSVTSDAKVEYIVAKWVLDGDTLKCRGVDSDFAKPATTSDALAKLLADNLNNDAAYSRDTNVYNRMSKERLAELTKEKQ
jgi:hypothetical protein